MIGVETSEPNTPPLVMVNVPPVRSSIVSLPSRARLAISLMSRLISIMPLRSASLMFGHDEPCVGRDGDAHVDVVLVDDGVAIDLRVDDRELLERHARRLHEERHEASASRRAPSRPSPCIRSRSAFTADMSTSLNVVRCAVACCDCSRFSAMRLRRVVIFSRVSRSPGAAAPLPPRGGGVGGAAGRAGAGARSALGDRRSARRAC